MFAPNINMSENIDSKRIYFENLDVIRFISAFMIVIVHAYGAWTGYYGQIGILSSGTYKELSAGGKYVDTFIHNFNIGVDIFFLLSGFLITYILLEEKKKYKNISIGNFIVRRSLRIWPLYFFLIGITPFLVQWVGANTPNYLANLFFLGNFDTIRTEAWTYPFGHFWSICVEEHFYLIWPFIIYLVPKKHLISTIAIIIVSSILFRIYCVQTMAHPWFSLYLNTLCKVDVLVIGALGAYFYSEKPFIFKLNRLVRVSLFALLILSLSIESMLNWDTMFLAAFRKFFYLGFFILLLMDYNFNPTFKHLLPKKSIIHYFGKISFGIYMYSNMLLEVVVKKIMWPYQINNVWVFFGITIALSIIIPIISYELMEKHFLKLSKRFARIQTDR
jgi:peptidoglycan/LPS O-acetylase OafA/YrhL